MKIYEGKLGTEALASMWERGDARDREIIARTHSELEQQVRASTVLPDATPEGIALGLFAAADQAIEQQITQPHGARIQCHRGCSHCCYLHVTATQGEARVALEAARVAKWSIDAGRLHRQAQHAGLDAWDQLSHADRACVFLTPAGDCAIYQYRPLGCRKYAVESDPADCDTVANPGGRVLIRCSPHAEIAMSVALSVFESGTLPAMLLAEMEAKP